MQQQAAHFVSGNYNRESRVTDMISTTGWQQSFVEWRAIAHLTLMYKIVHGVVDVSTATQVAAIHVILLICQSH